MQSDESQLSLATSELKDVDRVMNDLREELEQLESRRQMMMQRKVSMQQQISRLSQEGAREFWLDGSSESSAHVPWVGEVKGCEALQPGQPLVYTIDQDDTSSFCSAPPVDDWEQGFDLMEQAGKARDRAVKLRAHWLMNSSSRKNLRR